MNLDELEALCAKATPGPWVDVGFGRVSQGDETGRTVHSWEWDNIEDGEQDQADADFIAAARSVVPELVSEVRSLRHQNESLKAELVRLVLATETKEGATSA